MHPTTRTHPLPHSAIGNSTATLCGTLHSCRNAYKSFYFLFLDCIVHCVQNQFCGCKSLFFDFFDFFPPNIANASTVANKVGLLFSSLLSVMTRSELNFGEAEVRRRRRRQEEDDDPEEEEGQGGEDEREGGDRSPAGSATEAAEDERRFEDEQEEEDDDDDDDDDDGGGGGGDADSKPKRRGPKKKKMTKARIQR